MTIRDAIDYAEVGRDAPEPVEHEIVRRRSYSRGPEDSTPAEVVLECACGAYLGAVQEHYGGHNIHAEFAAHVEEVDRADR